MSDDHMRRGAKVLSDRDWVFGSRPRRRLLEAVLCGSAAQGEWSRPQLAKLAGVGANGGVDEHLNGLERLGLLEHDDKSERLWRASPAGLLSGALRDTLVALAGVPDDVAKRQKDELGARERIVRSLSSVERAVLASEGQLGPVSAEIIVHLAEARHLLQARLG
jgi:hypothetical protein